MFRIANFGSLGIRATCTKTTRQVFSTKEWQPSLGYRLYSKKSDRDRSGKCTPCDDKPPSCKTPKPVAPPIRPIPQQPPCYPPPFSQECPRPNEMDRLPKPVPNFAARDKQRRAGYLKTLLLGTAILLLTCFALYKSLTDRPPTVAVMGEKKKKRKHAIKKNPGFSKDIPSSVPYLLIGGGTASFSAFRAIKSADPTAKVLVISNEGEFPYMRPPLSKEIWFNDDPEAARNLMFKQWNGSERSLFYEPEDFYLPCRHLAKSENGGVSVARGWTVKRLDVVERKAYLEDNYEIQYDKCLIATGASPKNLDIFANASEAIQERVSLFRTSFDFQELYDKVKESENIAIIGGGFLGSELACSLARVGKKKGKQIYQVFKENGNMGKILPEYLSSWTTNKVKKEGVQVIGTSEVTGVRIDDLDRLQITLSTGRQILADHVIVAIGVEPNTQLAELSDLEVDPDLGGFLVNTELQARSNLFIAGDCSCFYDIKLGRRRVEHHDHAVVSGRLAGENMTGSTKPYWHQSMFWSDLGPDVGYEAIGIVDSTLPTVGVFAKATDSDSPKAVVAATNEAIRSITEEKIPAECQKLIKTDPEAKKLAEKTKSQTAATIDEDFGKGVIFYLRDDIVVGIVLWNVFNRMNIARQVLKEERKYDDLNEVAKLFNIHEE